MTERRRCTTQDGYGRQCTKMTESNQGLDHEHHMAAIPARGTPDEELDPRELAIDTFVIPGQPVHEGDRGVKITHRPTGATGVGADPTKSGLENRAEAMRHLRHALGLSEQPEPEPEQSPTMSGETHYRMAESLLIRAHDMADQQYPERAAFIVARAQVHATLALAAATLDAAFTVSTPDDHPGEERRWVSQDRNGEGYGR